ncbi:sulfatase [Niastella yeongjuensis]|uniref:Sulfatase n=1 Tax=Niastella yeongjuensis TaxID=354355 RepID=A0A1V9FCC5_9BACT|nr:formylglycine-generating enzyme family protein [Niastella yeongjuensis]OQP55927.1 sulfatase [Niastella yeongjuensis]SEP26827.1 Formylglycine-generating enzyme, required for sulfatase activity, contains SUMF1/FGE domain [Niastella yeongjuensis]
MRLTGKNSSSVIAICAVAIVAVIAACNQSGGKVAARTDSIPKGDTIMSCTSNLPSRFAAATSTDSIVANGKSSYVGMVKIPGGDFQMGAADKEGRPDEYPQHAVHVDGFYMDATEVTNAQFMEFVKATHYLTTAERTPDWVELQKQLPPGTPKPADSLLVAASLVFTPPVHAVALNDVSQWWQWVKGADWKHPEGPGSNLKGKENYPVVQVSWDDAMAYAKWAGKRLPTEAEWEWAARAGLANQTYTWGNEPVEKGQPKANIWQGHFPDRNTVADGFARVAPVKSFAANAYGLYDVAGNVWEWCSDWYRSDYYAQVAAKKLENPTGPAASYDPDEPTVPKRVVRGGSFLCHASYCASYRVSARMKTSPDTGLEHTGFRCVKQ